MHKNIWILLTAALSLNIAVFAADAQESQKGNETKQQKLFVNYESEEEQSKDSLLAADEEKQKPIAGSLLANNESEEEQSKDSLLTTVKKSYSWA